MDKFKQPFRKSKQRPFHKSKRSFHKSKRSFRRRLPPIQPGDRIDYRNISLLGRFISDQGKILSRGRNKVTLKQQRLITIAIKQARILSSFPFMNTTTGVKINTLTGRTRQKVKSDGKKKKRRPGETTIGKKKKRRPGETTINKRRA